MHCIIIDDDELSRKVLTQVISKIPELTCIEEFENPEKALDYLMNDNPCDLIFLDMEMPEMSGLEFIEKSPGNAQTIIVSSKPEYAAESYNYSVTDYIVKPISAERIKKALIKANDIKSNVLDVQTNPEYFFFKSKNGLEKINISEIQYIEALADYVQIQTGETRHVLLSTMKAMEQKLKSPRFLRIHRSFMVALEKIDKIEDNHVIIGGKLFPISRSHRQSFMSNINRL